MNAAEFVFTPILNHLLGQHDWARERLKRHAGQSFALISGPLNLQCEVLTDGYLSAQRSARSERDKPSSVAGPLSDVTLTLATEYWPSVLTRGLDEINGTIQISGDAELAESLGLVFRHLRWDAAEDISRITGDVLAQRLVNTAQATHTAVTQSLRAGFANVSEYLAEEAGMLVRPQHLHSIRQQLSTLRDDLARLEKRIRRLEQSS